MTDTLGEDRLLDQAEKWLADVKVRHDPEYFGDRDHINYAQLRAEAEAHHVGPMLGLLNELEESEDWLARLCARVRHLEAELESRGAQESINDGPQALLTAALDTLAAAQTRLDGTLLISRKEESTLRLALILLSQHRQRAEAASQRLTEALSSKVEHWRALATGIREEAARTDFDERYRLETKAAQLEACALDVEALGAGAPPEDAR